MYKSIIKQHAFLYLVIIIFSFLIVAGGSILENHFRPKNAIVEKSNIHIEQIFAVEDKNNIFAPINRDNYFTTYSFLNRFYNNTKDKFEYNKFCLNWETFKQEKQLIWLQKHIFVHNLSTKVIDCIFVLDKQDKRDFEYSKQNAQNFLNDVVSNIKETILKFNSNVTFIDIDSLYIDDTETINKEKIYIFNFINNCLLGLLLGFIICSIDILRRKQKLTK